MAYPLGLVSPHLKGPLVKEAQNLLKKNPFGVFFHGVSDGEYGPITASATKSAKFWLGYKSSDVDNKFGENLARRLKGLDKLTPLMKARRYQRLVAARNKPLAVKVRGLSRSQVGVKESPSGSNRQKYGLWYGLNGQPWCAIFCSWCITKSGGKFRYSYVPTVAADARAARGNLRAIPYSQIPTAIQAGHPVLACFDWEGDGKPDHIGIVDVWKADGNFQTVEGNTAIGNDSNGGEVMYRNRNRSQVHTFVAVH